ncbi:helix-turn-helix domain-containing protein [Saccharothrix luteola]|uniref:helix-turn-helix domain-containing protein n=1 Tax=Saccharothrix luteola TaxID=2893018 RepID=UPI001E5B271A|nr:helix-turn-helix domain-containing protein [Saccharothrix luteola]MCC8249392.1 helix-turn-helix domain-containing protein [Saccharothrix luteola]
MVVQLRYNFRVEPTLGRRIALARAFGCARVVFNDGLRARRTARDGGLPYIPDGELSKQVITLAKTTPERAWLGEVSAVVRVRWSRKLPAPPSSVTIVEDAAGRYFASFVVTAPDVPLPPVDREVGIDLG